jgi:hypothetical protein
MAAPRLRGQETFINLVVDGSIEQVWKALVDFTWTDDIEVQDEEFLGETSNRYDSIYKGTSFKASCQMESKAEQTLRRKIIEKAARRSGSAARFDITYTAALPNGEQILVILKDVSFGQIETGTSSRSDYTTMSFEGSCSETLEP